MKKKDDDDEWIPFFTLKNDDYGLPCEINAWNLHQLMKSIHKHMDAFCSLCMNGRCSCT
jgi:hypothetical protein